MYVAEHDGLTFEVSHYFRQATVKCGDRILSRYSGPGSTTRDLREWAERWDFARWLETHELETKNKRALLLGAEALLKWAKNRLKHDSEKPANEA